MTATEACSSCGSTLPGPGSICPNCATTQIGAPAGPETAILPRIVGGYRILRELGSGGMGTVYEAYEDKVDRRVALKVLSRLYASSERAAHRFALEAWIGGRLNHPNVVKVFERGIWEDLAYFSMELVEGGALAQIVQRLKEHGQAEELGLRFGTREYVHWTISQVIAAARGLDHAHRMGVVHRDIKPMNLLYSRELGTVKVADFGLAIEAEGTRLTTAGKMLGTPAYMAPEQILGRQDAIDARTDVYALGVTLFELLTLELPYAAATQQLYLNAVLTAEARRPSRLNERVSHDLEIVIRKALEKSRDDRYPSAGALADDLENVLNFRPIRARPPGTATRIARWVQRRPMHATLLAVLMIGVPAVALLSERAVEHQRLLWRLDIERLWADTQILMQREEYDRVVEMTTRILRLDPGHLDALRERTVARLMESQIVTDATLKADLQSRALTDAGLLVERRPREAWTHRMRAFVLSNLGRDEEVRAEEERAARLRGPTLSDDDLLYDGRLALNRRDYGEAVRLFSSLLVRRPSWAESYMLRGEAYDGLGQTDHAVADYRVAAALDPDDFSRQYALGRLLTRAGSLQEGEGYLRRAIELNAPSPYGHEALSDNLLRQGRSAVSGTLGPQAADAFRRAGQEARAALAIDPALPWAHVNLGASLIEENRLRASPEPAIVRMGIEHYEKARVLWQEARAGPDPAAYAGALTNLCDALLQLRELPRALPICREAALSPAADQVAWYNLAAVQALLGDEKEAFQALEQDFRLGDRDWRYLSSDPWFNKLRADSRFRSLLRRMKASREP